MPSVSNQIDEFKDQFGEMKLGTLKHYTADIARKYNPEQNFWDDYRTAIEAAFGLGLCTRPETKEKYETEIRNAIANIKPQ